MCIPFRSWTASEVDDRRMGLRRTSERALTGDFGRLAEGASRAVVDEVLAGRDPASRPFVCKSELDVLGRELDEGRVVSIIADGFNFDGAVIKVSAA